MPALNALTFVSLFLAFGRVFGTEHKEPSVRTIQTHTLLLSTLISQSESHSCKPFLRTL